VRCGGIRDFLPCPVNALLSWISLTKKDPITRLDSSQFEFGANPKIINFVGIIVDRDQSVIK
jgi:hypothetical protein